MSAQIDMILAAIADANRPLDVRIREWFASDAVHDGTAYTFYDVVAGVERLDPNGGAVIHLICGTSFRERWDSAMTALAQTGAIRVLDHPHGGRYYARAEAR